MGDRKQPNPPPGEPGSTAPPQRRPAPPPAPPPRVPLATLNPDGFCLGDEVVNKFAHGSPVMTVAGMRSYEGGRSVLCTWTEADGQAYHEWIPEGSLEMARGKKPLPPLEVYLKHVRCGNPVSIAVLDHDVAYYVYCEHCRDLVEEGELHPPVDEARVRVRVDRERVRPVEGALTGETREVQP